MQPTHTAVALLAVVLSWAGCGCRNWTYTSARGQRCFYNCVSMSKVCSSNCLVHGFGTMGGSVCMAACADAGEDCLHGCPDLRCADDGQASAPSTYIAPPATVGSPSSGEFKKEGEACRGWSDCRAGLDCVNKVCRPYKPNAKTRSADGGRSGDRCESIAECAESHVCRGGKCVPAAKVLLGDEGHSPASRPSTPPTVPRPNATAEPDGDSQVKKSRLGESCTKSADCEGDLRCVSQRCVSPFSRP